jgi:hypothetical protein
MWGLIFIRQAISLLVSPSARSSNASRSRGVSLNRSTTRLRWSFRRDLRSRRIAACGKWGAVPVGSRRKDRQRYLRDRTLEQKISLAAHTTSVQPILILVFPYLVILVSEWSKDLFVAFLLGPQRLGRYSAEGKLLGTKPAAPRVVEKTRDGKVQQPTLPSRLEIPHSTRDSHFRTTSATAS